MRSGRPRPVATNEHREAFVEFIDQDRVVESMGHVIVGNAVFSDRTLRNHPLVRGATDLGDPLEVAVVVQHHEV